MKKHPRIRELQLGKTVKEFVDELLEQENYNFQRVEEGEVLDKIVKQLVKLEDPNVRFGVFFKEGSAYIESINASEQFDIGVDYWDDDWGGYLEDDAWTDCGLLNQIVEELFGPRKKQRAKFTKTQLLKQKGKVCPHCGGTSFVVLDDFKTNETAQELGCKSCGLTWRLFYEKKLKAVVL